MTEATRVGRMTVAAVFAGLLGLTGGCGGDPVPTPTPVTRANFAVTSRNAITLINGTAVAANTADACPLASVGGSPQLDCTFNGASSTGSPTLYEWTYSFGARTATETSTSATYQPQARDCGFFGGQAASTSGAVSFIQMTVSLRVRDAQGTFSAAQTNQNVRIYPQRSCGYAF